MVDLTRRKLSSVLLAVALSTGAIISFQPSWAIEIGEPAPDFNLASTEGRDIALKGYRGKKWVLLEFYGADFAPT